MGWDIADNVILIIFFLAFVVLTIIRGVKNRKKKDE